MTTGLGATFTIEGNPGKDVGTAKTVLQKLVVLAICAVVLAIVNRVGKSRLLSLSIYNFRAADEMPLCFAFGCNHMTGAKRTCSLFRFPTNPKERNKWIQRCR